MRMAREDYGGADSLRVSDLHRCEELVECGKLLLNGISRALQLEIPDLIAEQSIDDAQALGAAGEIVHLRGKRADLRRLRRSVGFGGDRRKPCLPAPAIDILQFRAAL